MTIRPFIMPMLLFCAIQSAAQNDIGVHLGLYSSKFRYFFNDEFEAASQNAINRVEFGFLFNRKVSNKLGFGVELNYLDKGNEIPNGTKTILNQVEMILPVSYEFPIGKLSIFVRSGPALGYVIDGNFRTASGNKIDIDLKNNKDFKRLDYSIVLGGGLSYKITPSGKIYIDYRYRRSFKYSVDSQLEDFKLSAKNIGWGIGFGFLYNIKQQ
jgi:opacity protein-like surface antigen